MDPTGKGDQPVDDPEGEKEHIPTYDQKGDQIPPDQQGK